MSICIIGGGFIGKNFAKYIVGKNNKKIKNIFLLSKKKNKIQSIRCIKSSYSQKFFCNFFKNKKIKKIYFFSGVPHPDFCQKHSKKIFDIETKVLINVLESLKKINYKGKLFLSSSCAVYGNSLKSLSEKSSTTPTTLYSKVKLLSERIAINYSKIYKINLVIFRISSVYGHGLKRQVVYDIIKKLLGKKKVINIRGTGYEKRDFIYIKDLVRALRLVSEKKHTSNCEVFNIGSGNLTEIRTLIITIKKLLNSKKKIHYKKYTYLSNFFSINPSIRKLKKLKFKPSYRIEDGLHDMIKCINY